MNLTIATASVVLYVWIVLLQYHAARSEPLSNNLFAHELLLAVSEDLNLKTFSPQHLVCSPIAVNTILALIHLAAESTVERETRELLKLGQDDKVQTAYKYGDFLNSTFGKAVFNDNVIQLEMAHRLYMRQFITISEQYKNRVLDNFKCEIERFELQPPSILDKKINTWIEQHTKNKIRYLLQSNRPYLHFTPIYANAIYFKANWLLPLNEPNTVTYPFSFPERNLKLFRRRVDNVKFAPLPYLKALAVKIPFKDSDISFTIISPNKIEDFKTLQNDLKGVDLNKVFSNKLGEARNVLLPIFRIGFNIDLKETLKKLNCYTMFTVHSILKYMYDDMNQIVPGMRQKVILEVNEDGVEAAAATYTEGTPMSEDFTNFSETPFVFFIHDETTVYFEGYVDKYL